MVLKIQEEPLASYIPKGQNVLQKIFKEHFDDFKEQYDDKYAKTYGNYRLDRITEVVEEFLKCGNYKEGLARIKCTNPDCGHDYFIPLSCLSFYLCPSCHQKRTLLFGEQIAEEVLLGLPHRQFVFCIPKCLRVYFKYDRLLFSEISQHIIRMLTEYYNKVSGKNISSGFILAYQTAGIFCRFNPHWHGIFLEGGFDDDGNFQYLPITDTKKMTESFRRRVIKFFDDKKLINTEFAHNLLSWKNSGFSVDNSVKIPANNKKVIESLGQYIARCPVSVGKIRYEPLHSKVLYKETKYNDYFKENLKMFNVLDFIVEVTLHIPPKNKQYIRRYGLYASRTRGVWDRFPHITRLAPKAWKEKHNHSLEVETTQTDAEESSKSKKQQNSTWARLIKKVYGTDPLICPHCQGEMKIIAIILNPDETEHILKHLVSIGRAPPNFDSTSLN